MRWKEEKYPNNAEQVVEKFLLFPKCLDGEYRWLENAEIVQRYFVIYTDGTGKWVDYKWKNK